MAELTAPVMIDGKPYGYSCAAKIKGGKKQKVQLVPIEIIEMAKPNLDKSFQISFVRPNGKKGICMMWETSGGMIHSFSGLIFIGDFLYLRNSKKYLDQKTKDWFFS
jgi:hypothetical protein